MRKLLCLLLALTLVCGLFTGCETKADKMEQLSGRWYCRYPDTEETARQLLESMDFYEQEIALVDLASLEQVQVFSFTASGSYYFGYDTEQLQQCVRDFLAGAFDAMYNGRSTLGALYAASFDDMSREEFRLYYAELYSRATYEELLSYMTSNAYNYSQLSVTETGTFKLSGSKILCTVTGETEAESITYQFLEDGSLELEFNDVTLVCTR